MFKNAENLSFFPTFQALNFKNLKHPSRKQVLNN